MVDVLAVSYLSGWVIATLVIYAAAKRFADPLSPPAHPLTVSVLGGALWPLLVVGLVELSTLLAFTKPKPKPGVGTFA